MKPRPRPLSWFLVYRPFVCPEQTALQTQLTRTRSHILAAATQKQIGKVRCDSRALFLFRSRAARTSESNAFSKVNRKQLEIVASDRKIVNFNPAKELLSGP